MLEGKATMEQKPSSHNYHSLPVLKLQFGDEYLSYCHYAIMSMYIIRGLGLDLIIALKMQKKL